MKYLTLLFALVPALAHADSGACGVYQAHFEESQGNFTRRIDQYKKIDGSTYYVYTVKYADIPANSRTYQHYPVHLTLNGESATFFNTPYPQEIEGLVESDVCGFAGDTYNQISPKLFESVAQPDGLKDWDLSAQLDGQPAETAHFPAVRWDEARWE